MNEYMRTKLDLEGEILALKQLLEATDYKTLKYLEGYISETEYKEIKKYRESLRQKINELEAETASL